MGIGALGRSVGLCPGWVPLTGLQILASSREGGWLRLAGPYVPGVARAVREPSLARDYPLWPDTRRLVNG